MEYERPDHRLSGTTVSGKRVGISIVLIVCVLLVSATGSFLFLRAQQEQLDRDIKGGQVAATAQATKLAQEAAATEFAQATQSAQIVNQQEKATIAAQPKPFMSEIDLPAFSPWDVVVDKNDNLWISLPMCDPNPLCPVARGGAIVQVNKITLQVIHIYQQPSGFSSPLFLAIDRNGRIWFTQPLTNAIGQLVPNFADPERSDWYQWTVPTAKAAPYDLAFDASGMLWFTELRAHKIGRFDPVTQTFTETLTPSAESQPYGITGPDATTGSMWFTENSKDVARIASFKPTTTGVLKTTDIREYLTNPVPNSTPHLIATDTKGNVWWTGGQDRRIGRLVISQAAPGTSQGVTQFNEPPPYPECPDAPQCSMHTSGIGVDANGTVWFTDSLSTRLLSFSPENNQFTQYIVGGSLYSNAHPHDGLLVDGSVIYFTQEFKNKLGRLVPPGAQIP